MNFNAKDVKSWANIRELKVGDKGYFFNSISSFRGLNIDRVQCGKIKYMDKNWGRCFKSDLDAFNSYFFFLPLNAVKVDKPKEKKYRSFKSLNEIQSVLCGGDVTKYAFFDVGTHLTVRRKDERNREQVILTTSIEYKDGHLYLINHRRLDEWFNNFELLVNDAWVHFGIEVEEDE